MNSGTIISQFFFMDGGVAEKLAHDSGNNPATLTPWSMAGNPLAGFNGSFITSITALEAFK